MFFLYANISPSQFEPLFRLPRHTLFVECFWSHSKTRSTCFIGSKTTRLRLVVLNPIKHSCSFFKHYIIFTACLWDNFNDSLLNFVIYIFKEFWWRHSLFFLYANISPSQFEPLFGLPRHTLFVECFWSRSKTRSTCFIGSKTTWLRLVVLNLVKHSCSFFKHYIIFTTCLWDNFNDSLLNLLFTLLPFSLFVGIVMDQ